MLVTTCLVVVEGETEMLAKWFVKELPDGRDLGLALGQKISWGNSPTEEIQGQLSDGRQSMVCEVVVAISFVLLEKGKKMTRCLPLKDAARRLLLRSTKNLTEVFERELLKSKDWTWLEVDESGLWAGKVDCEENQQGLEEVKKPPSPGP